MVTKICPICNREFTTDKNNKLCNNDHIVRCSICGREFVSRKLALLREYKAGSIVTCDSRECRAEAKIRRSRIKYGVDSPLQLKSVRMKMYETYINNRISDDSKNKLSENSNKNLDLIQAVSGELNSRNIEYMQDYEVNGYAYTFRINNVLLHVPGYVDIDSRFLGKNYNRLMLENAEANSFRCIMLYNWEDISKIINIIDKDNRIEIDGKRDCDIREVDLNTCREFLDSYHYQNSCNSQPIRMGLYYHNELVEIMTVGKPRFTKSYQYEITRLCAHPKYKINNGFKTLLDCFILAYKPISIIGYCDNSKYNGQFYINAGFEYLKSTRPKRHWYKGTAHITENMIEKCGYNNLFDTNYNGISNETLMRENGWKEVYDCCQSSYIMTFEQIDQK